MTLIVVAAGPTALYLASDYRLTYSAAAPPETTMAGVKQFSFMHLLANSGWANGYVAFTGFAGQGSLSTREWISTAFEKLQKDCHLLEMKRHIQVALDGLSAQIRHFDRRLTVVMAGRVTPSHSDKPFLWVYSNFENARGKPLQGVDGRFRVYEVRCDVPCVRVFGSHLVFAPDGRRWSVVTRPERRHLISMLRDPKAEATAISSLLSTIVRRAAKRLPADPQGTRSVSEQCMVSTVSKDRMGSESYGGAPGAPDVIFGGINIGKWMRHNLDAADGSDPALFRGERASMRGKKPDGSDA